MESINRKKESLGKGKELVQSPGQRSWRRFRRHKLALLGAAIVFLLFFSASFAPFLAPCCPIALDLGQGYSPPSATHLLGTDEMGRDILSRLIFGSRVVVVVVLSATSLAAVTGAAVGLWVGYLGGIVDDVFMRILDVFMAFPAFLLAIALVAFLGPGVVNIIIVIAVTRFPRYARLIRGSTLSLSETVYVEAALAIGASRRRVILGHILPGCIGPFVVYISLTFGESILAIAGLSFLGLGIQPPTPDWGAMLARGRNYLLVAPWLAFAPGMAIFLTVLAFNLLGDGLRDALDPRVY